LINAIQPRAFRSAPLNHCQIYRLTPRVGTLTIIYLNDIFNTITNVLTMANIFEMCDLEVTLINEEHSVNVEVEMLELSLTQLSKHEEKLALKIMRPRVDQSVRLVWDHPPLPPNVSTLTIYLKFGLDFQICLGKFIECLAGNDDVCLFLRTWVPSDGHYRWLKGQVNNLPIKQRINYVVCTICKILDFL
jgi:hypothetical protein